MFQNVSGGDTEGISDIGESVVEGGGEVCAADASPLASQAYSANGGGRRVANTMEVSDAGEDTSDGTGTGVTREAVPNLFSPDRVFLIIKVRYVKLARSRVARGPLVE